MELDSDDGCNFVNIPKTTELDTLKVKNKKIGYKVKLVSWVVLFKTYERKGMKITLWREGFGKYCYTQIISLLGVRYSVSWIYPHPNKQGGNHIISQSSKVHYFFLRNTFSAQTGLAMTNHKEFQEERRKWSNPAFSLCRPILKPHCLCPRASQKTLWVCTLAP